MDTFTDSIPFLIISTGLILLMSSTAYASAYGIALSALSSALYTHKKIILTYSYLAVIMSSTIFFLSTIIFISISVNLKSDYPLEVAFRHFVSCVIMGFVGYAAGITMGNISKKAFKVLSKRDSFSVTFILLFSSAEILVIFAFLASLLIIYK